jgi:hypothetical protein
MAFTGKRCLYFNIQEPSMTYLDEEPSGPKKAVKKRGGKKKK